MNESYAALIKFLFLFLGILAIIFVLAVLTPKMAAVVDRLLAKIFKKNSGESDDSIYKVKSIYDLPDKDGDKSSDADNDKNVNGDVDNGEE